MCLVVRSCIPLSGIFRVQHVRQAVIISFPVSSLLKLVPSQRLGTSNKSSQNSQLIKRSFVEKSGSLVRFTPNFLKPAASPGVGMWVI